MIPLQKLYEDIEVKLTEEEARKIFKKEYVDKHIDKFKEVCYNDNKIN